MKDRSDKDLKAAASRIKWLFTDVDGTLTDGRVYYSADGETHKAFSLRDGTGFFLLRAAGLKTGILTGENSRIVLARAQKLNADECFLQVDNKSRFMEGFLKREGLEWDEIAYVGDDLNDVKLLRLAGIGIAVGDADSRAKDAADFVCSRPGGHGAFREAVEILLGLKGTSIEDIIERSL